MPIRRGRLADIQAQQVEVGRIRLGASTPKTSRSGKEYNEPVKLETFRLTSRSRDLINEAASLYGGNPEPWQPQSGGAQQWQVLTQRRSIAVIVPPEPVSQYYEAWTGGRCERRCDGMRELINDVSCPCGPDPAQRRCKPTTRLSLMLTEMSGIGVWRLETHGYYAAAELPAVADLLSAVGGNVPARLEMEERQAMVADPRDASKEVATRFMVPVLHVQRTPGQLVQILGGESAVALPDTPERVALPAAEQPSALAAIAAADHDPEQERQRVYQTLHDQFLGAITQAPDMAKLRGLGNAIRQSALPAQLQMSLRTEWQRRQQTLATFGGPDVVSPVPQASAAGLSQNGVGQMDRNAEMMAIQSTAAAHGMSLAALREAFGMFTEGQALAGATAEQLHEFHTYLRQEAQA